MILRKKFKLVIILCLAIAGIIYQIFSVNSMDPLVKKQWYLLNNGNNNYIHDSVDFNSNFHMEEGLDVDAIKMWTTLRRSKTNNQVVIALIDTGIDYNHEDLSESIWNNPNEIPNDGIDNDNNGYIDDIHGYNFCDNCGEVFTWDYTPEENNHGTLCAGIIAADSNGIGITGICGYSDVKIMSLKVLDNKNELNSGTVENIVEAIKYAENNGALICNLSLNVEDDNQELETAIKISKMLFVVSAGNGFPRGNNIDKIPSFPGSYNFENIITVANISYNGVLNITSNYGSNSVDLAAPGTCIYSTEVNNHYGFASGTSMAAPIVTGLAAIVYSQISDITAKEAKVLICKNVTLLTTLEGKLSSGGIVNGKNIVNNLAQIRKDG
ncbi:MAG: peptidase S8 [Bacteroidia bacterium]|nr:peptidase S8 [Bacteroidia bacterium]